MVLSIFILPIVSAGVGIKWSQESSLVNENTKTCLTYSVYNPWPAESNVKITVSDPLKDVLVMQESETKLVPANTASKDAIPIQFCFKTPKIYAEDCLIAGQICEQTCSEVQKEYSGEVVVQSVPMQTAVNGAGASSTTMAVSAPLNIKVRCVPHSRNYTLIYVLVALISLLIIVILLVRKYRTPVVDRDKARLKALKEKIKKEEKGKKRK